MQSILPEISFTKYSNSKFALHTKEGRHFIIGEKQKLAIEKVLFSEDVEYKNALIEKIKTWESTQKSNMMFFSDFQFRKPLINGAVMAKIGEIFKFLFYKNIFIAVTIVLFSIPTYFFFINAPNMAASATIPFGLSWFLVFFVFFFHEIGHATACVRYGVKPGEIGFGITFYLPMMYANVSEVWRLEQKQRMVVNFGGIYFQNIFALILLFISLATKQLEVYYVSKAVFISTLYQFFPFYRSDGYWILSDLTGVPNLFKTSRELAYKQIRNPFMKLGYKSYLTMIYYLIINGIVWFFIVRMGIFHFKYIIDLPFYLINTVRTVLSGAFSDLSFDVRYLWAGIYLFFTSKMLINNTKNILSKGADKMQN